MRGPGRGQGGQTGALPTPKEGFKPTMLPGALDKGKIMASIMQKGAPEKDARPAQGFIEAEFLQVQQEAEQALSKEEIPAGSKEFVRQYFGTLEPDREPSQP